MGKIGGSSWLSAVKGLFGLLVKRMIREAAEGEKIMNKRRKKRREGKKDGFSGNFQIKKQ